MLSFDEKELEFAQKYPFSPAAKSIVKNSGFSLEEVPRSVLARARSMVASAYARHDYSPKIREAKELLVDEVLAFPVSKILVSAIDSFELNRKFASMVSSSVFRNLEGEKDDALFGLASDLGVKFSLPDSGFFAELGVADYLRPELNEPFLKLVNARLENGKVLMRRNDFTRFLAAVARQQILDSLPVPLENVPESFREAADAVKNEFMQSERKKFSRTDFGRVAPEFFPPCMAKIYSDLMAGANVNHSARFAFAAFLGSIGMGTEKIIEMYGLTPNFSEKVTRYQVERIAGKKGGGYSAPSCDKMRSYNLCVADCPVSHPVQFYSHEYFKGKNPEKPAQGKAGA